MRSIADSHKRLISYKLKRWDLFAARYFLQNALKSKLFSKSSLMPGIMDFFAALSSSRIEPGQVSSSAVVGACVDFLKRLLPLVMGTEMSSLCQNACKFLQKAKLEVEEVKRHDHNSWNWDLLPVAVFHKDGTWIAFLSFRRWNIVGPRVSILNSWIRRGGMCTGPEGLNCGTALP